MRDGRVGITLLMCCRADVGKHVDMARWVEAAETMPAVLDMPLTRMSLRADGQANVDVFNSLLITVSNTSRAAAGLDLAPGALLDDGRLDVCVYADMVRPQLLAAALPATIGARTGNELHRFRVSSLEIDAARPMPVSIESNIVGVTPVCYTLMRAALQVIAGDTRALLAATSGRDADESGCGAKREIARAGVAEPLTSDRNHQAQVPVWPRHFFRFSAVQPRSILRARGCDTRGGRGGWRSRRCNAPPSLGLTLAA